MLESKERVLALDSEPGRSPTRFHNGCQHKQSRVGCRVHIKHDGDVDTLGNARSVGGSSARNRPRDEVDLQMMYPSDDEAEVVGIRYGANEELQREDVGFRYT